MRKIPSSITKIPHLEILSIRSPFLEDFPKKIGDLKELTQISIGNSLTSLPDSFKEVKKLEYLYIGNNMLTKLPESVFLLTNLKAFHIENNKLTTLSNSIGNLKNLEAINIKKNIIKELPEMLISLTKLKILFLDKKNLNNKAKKIVEKLKNSGVEIL